MTFCSFDNVFAVVPIANGNKSYIVIGLLLSILILVFGSNLIAKIFSARPSLIVLGIALLGWSAGSLLISDQAVQNWILVQAPTLVITVPVACVGLVVWSARANIRLAQRNVIAAVSITSNDRKMASKPIRVTVEIAAKEENSVIARAAVRKISKSGLNPKAVNVFFGFACVVLVGFLVYIEVHMVMDSSQYSARLSRVDTQSITP